MPWHLPRKATPVIDFTDEPVIPLVASFVENSFVNDCK